MQNKKNKKSRLFLNCLIIAMAAVSTLSASVMAGCSDNESSETSATTVVKETQIVTEIVTVTENVTVSDENGTEGAGESSAESSEQGADSSNSSQSSANGNQSSAQASGYASSGSSASSKASSVSSSSKTSSSSSKTSSSSSKTSSSTSTSSSSGNTSNNASSDVLSIAGNKFHVGDTVTCVLNITTPDIIENYQGTLKYDDKYLEATSAALESPAKSGGIFNYNKSGLVIFNGSSALTGYDYTEGGKMLTVTFKVKAAGSTTPTVDWVVVRQLSTGISGTNYISNGKPANGMKATLSYS